MHYKGGMFHCQLPTEKVWSPISRVFFHCFGRKLQVNPNKTKGNLKEIDKEQKR